jgi:predicted nucleic acid-binding protein
VPTVSNSSPLIALAAIGRLESLRALFHAITIPTAVAAEIATSISTRPDWVQIWPLAGSLAPSILGRLGRGEREALGLALELGPEHLVVDDMPARRVAQRHDVGKTE